MYKRRSGGSGGFKPPLLGGSATAAAAAQPQQQHGKQPQGKQQHGKQQQGKQQTQTQAQALQKFAAELKAGGLRLPDEPSCDKENAAPAAALPAPKKQKLFVPPAAGLGRPQQQRSGGAAAPRATSTAAGAAAGAPAAAAAADAGRRIFAVLYTKRAKFAKVKDKGYQDGVIDLRADKTASLLDMDGKVVTKGKAKLPGGQLESGSILELGNVCCEYDKEVALEDFKRGTCFTDASKALALPGAAAAAAAAALPAFKPSAARKPLGLPAGRPGGLAAGPPRGPAAAAAAPAQAPAPLFDPCAPGAIVVNAGQWQQGAGRVVPVVVDPYLGRQLRPHQAEGVGFMYEAVMGLRGSSPEHKGCLLADEMGLGKTLQVLALLWTLLRQGPEGAPVVRKAVVVAPATLVANWGKECKKWLGTERLRYMQLNQGPQAAEQVRDFKLGTVWKLLIASYETLRKYGAELAGSVDLLVCDEGHRLKAKGGNQTINALLAIGCPRRIVLTGTPVQNNLDEFFALLSFAVPGALGPAATFKRVYGDPITRSRDRDATPDERELGAARAEELQRQASAFMLRRTQDVLSKHLPPLHVHTVFCQPSPLQVEVYRAVLRSKNLSSLLYGTRGGGGGSEGVLPAITVLRKLCNHPSLLQVEGADAVPPEAQSTAQMAATLLQAQLAKTRKAADAVELSGKLVALEALLGAAISEGCKAVVVSTSTSALGLVDNLLCGPRGWRSVRIDGGTSVEERQTVVDNFNLRGVGQVFLLSTRAGGAGLNLIGANHLVLLDSDWNPAMDLQAMSRIWRDGQTRPCFVTRLLTAGTLEEKVYQRQLQKSDLAGAAVQGGGGATSLSSAELKQLFQLELVAPGGDCSTRSVLAASGAAPHITWLPLHAAGGAGAAATASGSTSLPTVLAAAVAAGVVTSVNREERTSEPGAPAGAAPASPLEAPGQAAAPGAASGAPAQPLDVDALEVEEDW